MSIAQTIYFPENKSGENLREAIDNYGGSTIIKNMRSDKMNYECEFKTANGYIGNATITVPQLNPATIKKELARLGFASVVAVRVYDQKLNRVF